VQTNNDIARSFRTYQFYVAYRNDVYSKRFFAEYCIVGIPHNTAI